MFSFCFNLLTKNWRLVIVQSFCQKQNINLAGGVHNIIIILNLQLYDYELLSETISYALRSFQVSKELFPRANCFRRIQHRTKTFIRRGIHRQYCVFLKEKIFTKNNVECDINKPYIIFSFSRCKRSIGWIRLTREFKYLYLYFHLFIDLFIYSFICLQTCYLHQGVIFILPLEVLGNISAGWFHNNKINILFIKKISCK